MFMFAVTVLSYYETRAAEILHTEDDILYNTPPAFLDKQTLSQKKTLTAKWTDQESLGISIHVPNSFTFLYLFRQIYRDSDRV